MTTILGLKGTIGPISNDQALSREIGLLFNVIFNFLIFFIFIQGQKAKYKRYSSNNIDTIDVSP